MQVKKLLALGSISLGIFVPPFTLFYFLFMLTQYVNYYKTGIFEVIWIPISSLISFISFYTVLDRISSLYGRDKMYYIGSFLYLLSILFIMIFPNMSILIVLFFIMGISLSIIYSNALKLLHGLNIFNGQRNLITYNSLIFLSSIFFSFVVGGYFTNMGLEYPLSVLLLFSILMIIFSTLSFNNYSFIKLHEELDVLGSFLYAAFLTLLIFFMMLLNIYPIYETLYFLIMSLIFFIIFIYIEKNVSNPIIDPRSFKNNKKFLSLSISSFITYLSIIPIFFILPIYMEVVLKTQIFLVGLIISSFPFFALISFLMMKYIIKNENERIISMIGLILLAVSFVLISLFIKSVYIPYFLILSGIGFGIYEYSNYISFISISLREENLSSTNTLETLKLTGTVLSISLFSLLLSFYLNRNQYISYSGIFLIQINPEIIQNSLNIIFIISAVMILISLYFSSLLKR